jgi:predicted deacylase
MPGLLMPIVEFEPLRFSAGVKATYGLGAPVYNHGTTCVLPALLVRGYKPGPLLVATAGVHGDEYEGARAIRLAFERLEPASLSGTFLGLPQVNPLAYYDQTRKMPDWIDGLDLNRCWPGKAEPAGGRPTEMLADFAWRIISAADLLADLHAGGSAYEFASVSGHPDIDGPSAPLAAMAAAAFAPDYLWRMPRTDGVLAWEFSRRTGKPAVVCETAGRGGCSNDEVERYRAGLMRTMGLMGMIKATPSSVGRAPVPVDTLYQETPSAGSFFASVRVGQRVAADQPLGVICDEYGDPLAEPRAAVSGVVLALRYRTRITTDDWLCCIGVVS